MWLWLEKCDAIELNKVVFFFFICSQFEVSETSQLSHDRLVLKRSVGILSFSFHIRMKRWINAIDVLKSINWKEKEKKENKLIAFLGRVYWMCFCIWKVDYLLRMKCSRNHFSKRWAMCIVHFAVKTIEHSVHCWRCLVYQWNYELDFTDGTFFDQMEYFVTFRWI